MTAIRPATGDILEVKVGTFYAGQAGINVYHYQVLDTHGLPPNLVDYAVYFDVQCAPLYKALMSNSATYYGVSVNKIWPAPVGATEVSHAHTGVGDEASRILPKQVSGIITKQTIRGGRAGRGRVYVPWPSQSYESATETPTDAYVTALDALAGAMFVGQTVATGVGNDANLVPVIYHRATHLVDEITEWVSRQKWATQMRRGDYGRANSEPVL